MRTKISIWFQDFLRVLSRYRPLLAGSFLEYLIVTLVFFLITSTVMGFIPFYGLDHVIFSNNASDATAGLVWANTVDNWSGFFASYTDMTNYPVGESLVNPYVITGILLWTPVRILSFIFNPITAINLITIGGFMSTAIAMYWLLKRLTGNIAIAFFAGFAVAFFPYAIAKGSAHLAYTYNVFFVLLTAAFIYFWRNPNWKSVLLFAFAIAVPFYFDGYFILLTAVLVGTFVIAGLVYAWILKQGWGYIWKRAKLLCLGFVAVLLLVSPIAIYSLSSIKEVSSNLASSRSDISLEIPYYKTWLIDYILPAQDNPILTNETISNIQDYRASRSDALSYTSYLGFVNIILAVLGLVMFALGVLATRVKKLKKYSSYMKMSSRDQSHFMLLSTIFIVTAVVCVGFMLSPEVTVLGKTIKMPGYIFILFDIGLWRNLSRFSGPLEVVLVLYAAYSLWLALKYSRFMKKLSLKKVKIVSSAIILILIGFMTIEYLNPINIPSYDTRNVDKAYQWLEQHPDVEVVAELPSVDPLDNLATTYATLQLSHKKKLVNPKMPEHRIINNTLGSLENDETVDWFIARGAQAVIVHAMPKSCPQVSWGKLELRDDSTETCLYMVVNTTKRDGLFAVVKSGVDATPNYTEGSKNTMRLNSDTIVMELTDSNFDKAKGRNCPSHISFEIYNWNRNSPIEGSWTITQDGAIKATGHVGPVKSDVSADVDCSKEVILKIDRQNKGNDLLLQKLDADYN